MLRNLLTVFGDAARHIRNLNERKANNFCTRAPALQELLVQGELPTTETFYLKPGSSIACRVFLRYLAWQLKPPKHQAAPFALDQRTGLLCTVFRPSFNL